MSSEFNGDHLPESLKTAKFPKESGEILPVLSKLDERPTWPKPPSGTSGSSLQVKSDCDDQIRSNIRLRSARLGTAGRPYQQHLHPGPFPKLERKPLARNPLKVSCPKETLPAIHNTPPVIEPGTDHKPRASKSIFDSLPACVRNRPKPETPKALYITPKEALKLFGEKLTDFEREEITKFPQIYFLGLDAQKVRAVEGAPKNHGYDDANGVYIKVLNDHIQYRYEVLELLGKGSFGQVLKCLDHKTKEQVALKMLINRPRNHHQAQKELRILELLRKKDQHNHFNIIHMKEHFVFRDHVCITFELQGINLYEAIKNQRQGFSQATVRRFTRSILKCLQVLHHERIIHCDLKPENIVLTKPGSTNIKVIDFGSSCHENERVYTYIQSRYYRAPEVILGTPYGLEIDMWSLGCIIAELYTGRCIFPGENEKEQMALIMEVLGLPPEEVLQTAPRKKKFFDANGNPKSYANTRGMVRIPGAKDLASVLRSTDPLFLDFVKRCLEWDPKKRMTPDEAITHDWFVEAQKRCQTRACNRRIDTPPQSVTKAQRSPIRVQKSTSASKTQHRAGKMTKMASSHQKGIERSPKQVALKTPKLMVTGTPKQAAERSSKQGITKSPKQPNERSPKPGVVGSSNLAGQESLIPRPPKQPAERPAKHRTHKLVVNKVSTSPNQATETSSWQGVTNKSPKEVAVTASPDHGTPHSPKQWVPRPPPNQEGTDPSSGGRKCELVRRRTGRRIVIPPSDSRTLSSDLDLNQACRRLN